jgi:hypothetical protein
LFRAPRLQRVGRRLQPAGTEAPFSRHRWAVRALSASYLRGPESISRPRAYRGGCSCTHWRSHGDHHRGAARPGDEAVVSALARRRRAVELRVIWCTGRWFVVVDRHRLASTLATNAVWRYLCAGGGDVSLVETSIRRPLVGVGVRPHRWFWCPRRLPVVSPSFSRRVGFDRRAAAAFPTRASPTTGRGRWFASWWSATGGARLARRCTARSGGDRRHAAAAARCVRALLIHTVWIESAGFARTGRRSRPPTRCGGGGCGRSPT